MSDQHLHCINCGIATWRRNPTIGLRQIEDEGILSVIQQWVAPQVVNSSHCICRGCRDLVINSLGVGEQLSSPTTGHRQVCVNCGRSVLRARSHLLRTDTERERSIHTVICEWILPRTISSDSALICHGCWVRADRNAHHFVSAPSGSSSSVHEPSEHEELALQSTSQATLQTPRPSEAIVLPDYIKVTSGPSLTLHQGKISLGPDFNPVITDIKSEADLIKQEVEDPQSDDTLSLAEDADQLSDADQPSEDLISLSNAQVPLSNAPDPLSDVKVEEVLVGVDEAEVTRPVGVTRQVELTTPVKSTTRSVEATRAVEGSTVPLPFSRNDCYKLIKKQANQINKLSERCAKQRKKLHSCGELVRRRDKRISNLRAELEALRSFIGECGWEVSSSVGGKIDVRRIQIRSPNTVVGQKKPNRQLLIVKRDYKPPKSSLSAPHTSDTQTPTLGIKRPSVILQDLLLDTLHTSNNRRKSSVGVKRTLEIQEKSSVSKPDKSNVLQKSSVGVKRMLNIQENSSVSIPATSDVLQKSSVGVKRILNNPSIAVQPKSVVPQTSSVGFQRTSDVRQNALVIQIDGMHDTVPRPKLVRLDDNSMDTG